MAQVLITSKTNYGSKKCVGGLLISNNQYLRLLKPGGYYQDSDTSLNIGDIWDLTYSVAPNTRAPHNEDVYVTRQRKISTVSDLKSYLQNKKGLTIWSGDLDNIFNQQIEWTRSGSGYICESGGLPTNSVGFWLANEDMEFDGKHYKYSRNRRLTYKGTQEPLETIPSGTLVRLSLAKWWQPDDVDIEERCYLQLSGWY